MVACRGMGIFSPGLASGSEGPDQPKGRHGKVSFPDGGAGQFLCTQVLLYGTSDQPGNQIALRLDGEGWRFEHRVLKTHFVPHFETQRQRGKTCGVIWLQSKNGIKGLKQEAETRCFLVSDNVQKSK